MEAWPRLPAGFQFGVATAAYQIEGGVDADGRGRSVWDTFSHTPGRTRDGDTGDVACDSYHRYPQDVALIAGLGAQAYRFSVAWPRVQPDGRGAVNRPGLDYYSRLVDALLEVGIEPVVTLFHWDLPQALEDAGGWLNRDTAARFADYAGTAHAALGDRVPTWITLNEPFVHTTFGYGWGTHAPGRRLGLGALVAAHHQLLGHGLAVQALRADGLRGRIGITNACTPVRAASTEPADAAAAARYDAVANSCYNDPVLLGRYPAELAELAPAVDLSAVRAGDLAVIAAPLDFLCINYYFPTRVRAATGGDNPMGADRVPIEGVERTAFDWPVVPDGLRELLVGLSDRYGDALPPISMTENGAAFPDVPADDGRVEDPRRIAFLDGHLRALHQAIEAGVDVRGYFVWSLLDNFEWAEGYSKRFGLVYVDFATGRRTPKSSYDWYRKLIAAQR